MTPRFHLNPSILSKGFCLFTLPSILTPRRSFCAARSSPGETQNRNLPVGALVSKLKPHFDKSKDELFYCENPHRKCYAVEVFAY